MESNEARPLGSHRSDSSINLNRNEELQNDELCNNTRNNERHRSVEDANSNRNSKLNRMLFKNIPQKSFDKCETVNIKFF